MSQPVESQLANDITQSIAHYRSKVRHYARLNKVVLFSSIACALVASLLGFLDYGHWAGAISLLTTALIGGQRQFALAEKARFYGSIRSRLEDLGRRLRYSEEPERVATARQVANEYRALMREAREGAPTVDWGFESSQAD